MCMLGRERNTVMHYEVRLWTLVIFRAFCFELHTCVTEIRRIRNAIQAHKQLKRLYCLIRTGILFFFFLFF